MAGPWALIPMGIMMAVQGVSALLMSKNNISQSDPIIQSVKVTSSAHGCTRAVLYGQNRKAGNIIWYGDYTSWAHTSTTSAGGKGGGQTYSNTSFTYTASFELGLCEGPIVRIVKAWAGDGVISMSNWEIKTGTPSQTAWAYMSSAHPTQALKYLNLAYLCNSGYYLGSYPTFPNFSFILEGLNNYYGDSDTASETKTLAATVTVAYSAVWSETNSVTYSAATAATTATPTYSDADTFTLPLKADALFAVGRGVSATLMVDDGMGGTVASVVTSTVASVSYSTGVTTVNLADAVLDASLVSVAVTGGPHALAEVSSSPGLGEYVDNEDGTYTFNAYESGSVVINYDYLVTCGGQTSEVIADIITNTFYGLGLDSGVIDMTTYSFDDYCLANEIFLSPVFESQAQAKDVVELLLRLCNTDVVWGDNKIIFVPLGDEAATSSYGSWTPSLTPVVTVDYDDILDQGEDSLRVIRSTSRDAYNHVAIQHVNQDNDFNAETTEYQDQGDIITNGKRSMGTITANGIITKTLALKLGRLMCKRSMQVRNRLQFALPLNFVYLRPLDIIAVTSSHHGLTALPVRIVNMKIGKDEIQVEAEDLGQGSASAPTKTVTGTLDGYAPNKLVDPGDANEPVIFSPPLDLASYEIWLATAGGSNWGGCNVWISQDGSTYEQAGTMIGPSRYGIVSDPGYWSREYFDPAYFDESYWDMGSDDGLPAASASPDETNTLRVDLTDSSGELTSGTQAEADSLRNLCYVGGEYISFQTATLRGSYIYDLDYLVRGCYGSSMSAHAVDSEFVRLDSAIFKHPINQADINKTIYIKLQSFNIYGYGLQDLADCTAHSYVVESPGTQPGRAPVNLSVGNNSTTPNTKLDVAFDSCDVAHTSNGHIYTAGAQGFTIDFGATGANGLDAGSIAADTWYYLYVIANTIQGTVAGLASTSGTTPTLPSGYTHQKVVGAVCTDGSAHIIDVNQVDYELLYAEQQVHANRTSDVGYFDRLYFDHDYWNPEYYNFGSAQEWDVADLSDYVPPIATRAWITIEVTAAAAEVTVGARKNGTSGDGQIGGKVAAATTGIVSGWVDTDLNQRIELYISPAPTTWTVSVNGFRFNV